MAEEQNHILLSTTDNPYSPFDEWDLWLMEDIRLGHNTCGLLARLTNSAESFDDDAEVAAMREVVQYNFSGKHIAVVRSDYDPFLKKPLTKL